MRHELLKEAHAALAIIDQLIPSGYLLRDKEQPQMVLLQMQDQHVRVGHQRKYERQTPIVHLFY